MPGSPPKGYRLSQIALHWFVVVAVLFLFFSGDQTTERFLADLKGSASSVGAAWIAIHIVVGLAILAAMLCRLVLRWRFGAPIPPEAESAPLRWLAAAVHVGLYLDMIGAALIGLVVYFAYPALAPLHEFLTRLALMALVALHVAGALWHHFYWRDDVLMRMFRPARG
jgi:cytochrome b561